ncbi:FMN-dependent NADH-azoreductase [Mycoplasma sp. Mirounga ES2805-ORL]|uniref:FMN-dependent NADH-azoreductase n=1 Tax=Mycoplasma sp. Mirounga ES2805-ORL TaxID=754514 RepID=UPI00197C4BD4|nr:FMN-dependent NADH-azoreductase [Mycoplasma sp. Mirounga ES2805-ORL]QSF13419.1 FMN-dependent NADH-azoreductase [Mycoplasma sp. Mirounga ES2805-ORL]
MAEKKPIKILTVNGSVNGLESLSWKVNSAIVQELIDSHPKSYISVLDLNDTSASTNSLNSNNFKTDFFQKNSDEWINMLKNTDVLIINTPMINFNYSSLVKNFIDAICVADKTFSYKYSKKGGAIGLLDNLNVIIVGTQGAPTGWYEFGNHVKMLEGTFKFLGAKKVETISINGTKVEPYNKMTHDEILKENEPAIKKIANKF